jgi:Ca2+-binding RTX toxin-like protein
MSSTKRNGDNEVITQDAIAFGQQAFDEMAAFSSDARDVTTAAAPIGANAKSVTGTYVPASSLLTVSGTNAANTIEISRNAAGQLLVNNGASPIVGGTPTVANTALITVYGQGGDDVITLNQANGALPAANLFGGAGNDTITAGAGNDQLFGQAGNDTLYGAGGFDFLSGGDGNDTLTGGDADDQIYGEAGNDLMIWNPGDDSDFMEGGADVDTVQVNAGGGAEIFTITANGTRVRFDRLDPAPFALDIGTTENLVVNMNGGNDSISATGNLAALINITVNGGAGNDTILGSNGADTLNAGDDDDFVDGQQGNDTVNLGAGNDVFQWDPGDGSDIVEGGAGTDRMLFNGSSGAELMEASAVAGRLRFTRNLGTIQMDVNDVETVDVNALGNTDTIVVQDLSTTDVTEINVNLAGLIGGTFGDAQFDTVTTNGTTNGDVIDVVGAGTSVSVLGLPARVNTTYLDATDAIVVNGQGGNDTITATTVAAGVAAFTLDGGVGNDTILGSQGNDVLLGGEGADFVFGDNGNDTAFLGAADDQFQWNPGDGNDTVEGQDGVDTLTFFGANIAENVSIFANAGRAQLFRDISSVTMDTNDLERIDFKALGGADNIVIGDLAGTEMQEVRLDLSGPNGGGDGAADLVTVNGTQGSDTIGVALVNGEVAVTGTQAAVRMSGMDASGVDLLTVNGQGGNDVINASQLGAGFVALTLNGGLGGDVMTGSAGDDLTNGGDGDDVAFMGAGDDTFVWNPGDDNDTIEGQTGFDTLLFQGANIGEQIAMSANGGRVLFTRDVATVTMDTSGVERIQFNARGGADNIVVGDLSGTQTTDIELNLESSPGSGVGDVAADNVTVNGTSGDDVAVVVGGVAGVTVAGLSAQVDITGVEGALDTLTINGGGGADVIDASSLAAGAVRLVVYGGEGDDVIIGSDGDDYLYGGAGNDVIVGGLGNDVIDGGDGDDIEIQSFTAGGGSEDAIDFSGQGYTFEWLIAQSMEVNGDTVLDLGDHHVTLRGVSLSALHQDDFLL